MKRTNMILQQIVICILLFIATVNNGSLLSAHQTSATKCYSGDGSLYISITKEDFVVSKHEANVLTKEDVISRAKLEDNNNVDSNKKYSFKLVENDYNTLVSTDRENVYSIGLEVTLSFEDRDDTIVFSRCSLNVYVAGSAKDNLVVGANDAVINADADHITTLNDINTKTSAFAKDIDKNRDVNFRVGGVDGTVTQGMQEGEILQLIKRSRRGIYPIKYYIDDNDNYAEKIVNIYVINNSMPIIDGNVFTANNFQIDTEHTNTLTRSEVLMHSNVIAVNLSGDVFVEDVVVNEEHLSAINNTNLEGIYPLGLNYTYINSDGNRMHIGTSIKVYVTSTVFDGVAVGANNVTINRNDLINNNITIDQFNEMTGIYAINIETGEKVEYFIENKK